MDKYMDRLTPEIFKSIFYRHAHRSKASLFSRMDVRILFLWHLIFALTPWFIYSPVSLGLLFAMVCAAAVAAGTAGFLILLMGGGVFCNLLTAGIAAFLLGAELTSIMADAALMTVKLLIVSLASVSVFTSVDSEKMSDGLLSLGVPPQICFAVSYGYRMLPLMIEEYHEVLLNYRIRSGVPARIAKSRLLYGLYRLKLTVAALYPVILNTAKRTRTTVEALEMKGLGYHRYNPSAKRLKLEYMRIRRLDVIFIAVSILLVVCAGLLGLISRY